MASICEFLGAVLLGSEVAGTIKSGIAKLAAFQPAPTIFMIGAHWSRGTISPCFDLIGCKHSSCSSP